MPPTTNGIATAPNSNRSISASKSRSVMLCACFAGTNHPNVPTASKVVAVLVVQVLVKRRPVALSSPQLQLQMKVLLRRAYRCHPLLTVQPPTRASRLATKPFAFVNFSPSLVRAYCFLVELPPLSLLPWPRRPTLWFIATFSAGQCVSPGQFSWFWSSRFFLVLGNINRRSLR